MAEEICAVGIAEYMVGRSPGKLVAYGLGSCVGVMLYDRVKKAGGLAHVMLPSSRLYEKIPFPAKFADTAIEALLKEMKTIGCSEEKIISKIVGGANMFAPLSSNSIPIGLRNISAVREKLLEKGIPLVAEEVGGTQGRTVTFDLEDGRVEIRKLNFPTGWL